MYGNHSNNVPQALAARVSMGLLMYAAMSCRHIIMCFGKEVIIPTLQEKPTPMHSLISDVNRQMFCDNSVCAHNKIK